MPWLDMLAEDHLEPGAILLDDLGTQRIECFKHLDEELEGIFILVEAWAHGDARM